MLKDKTGLKMTCSLSVDNLYEMPNFHPTDWQTGRNWGSISSQAATKWFEAISIYLISSKSFCKFLLILFSLRSKKVFLQFVNYFQNFPVYETIDKGWKNVLGAEPNLFVGLVIIILSNLT